MKSAKTHKIKTPLKSNAINIDNVDAETSGTGRNPSEGSNQGAEKEKPHQDAASLRGRLNNAKHYTENARLKEIYSLYSTL